MKKVTELHEDLAYQVASVVEQAPVHGRSIAWQEQWKKGVMAGLSDAENGNFASSEEIEDVLGRYDQM